MSDGPVLLRRNGSVAWITLNRPQSNNSIDLAMALEFRDTVLLLEADPTCDVVMIAGNGRTFSTGGDLPSIAETADVPALLTELAEAMNVALLTLHSSRMVVVAVVNGVAAGAGLGIVLNADIAIASSRAAFLTAYSAIGLTPDCGVSYLLPQVVGLARAMELSLTGRTLRAAEALEWNIVSEVLASSDLMDRAEVLSERLAMGTAGALGETKRLLRGDVSGYAAHLCDEVRTIAKMGASAAAQELISVRAKSR
jgi:2-(1,2-epoxy-1,2-dihydrophenyl)acetyl-CoA isomerase